MLYDRKIKYLDYYEGGSKVNGGGFAKLEVRGNTLRIELTIRGLHPTDSFERDIVLQGAEKEETLGQIRIQNGCGQFRYSCGADQEIGATGISYSELRGIRIPIGGTREILCQWDNGSDKRRITPPEENLQKSKPVLQEPKRESIVESYTDNKTDSEAPVYIENEQNRELKQEKAEEKRKEAKKDGYESVEDKKEKNREDKDREERKEKDGENKDREGLKEKNEEYNDREEQKEKNEEDKDREGLKEKDREDKDKEEQKEKNKDNKGREGKKEKNEEYNDRERQEDKNRENKVREGQEDENREDKDSERQEGKNRKGENREGKNRKGENGEGEDRERQDRERQEDKNREDNDRETQRQEGKNAEDNDREGQEYKNRESKDREDKENRYKRENKDGKDNTKKDLEKKESIESDNKGLEVRGEGMKNGKQPGLTEMQAQGATMSSDVRSPQFLEESPQASIQFDQKSGDQTKGKPDMAGNDRSEQPDVREAPVKLMEDKWQQLSAIYPHIQPFRDERDYLSLTPSDFVLFPDRFYRAVNNSFLLHGYYNYHHLILARIERRGEILYYIGVPGNYFEREKQVAIMFGFESFECETEPAKTGDFGYYMMRTEL